MAKSEVPLSPIGALIDKYRGDKPGYLLSNAVGKSESYLSKIRKGVQSCPPKMAIALADALGAPREEFLRAAGHSDFIDQPPNLTTIDGANGDPLLAEFLALCDRTGWHSVSRAMWSQKSRAGKLSLIAALRVLEASSEESGA